MTKVLIADDMRNFLNLERSFLSRSDCEIITASTGLEAIKIASKEHPDIIMLDIEMPEMTGIEATRIMQANPDLKKIPIIIVSSTDRDEEALKAGAKEFLKKPVNEDKFIAAIQRHVHLPIRQFIRKELNTECNFSVDGRESKGIIKDISEGGIFICANSGLNIGDAIEMTIQLPLNEGIKKEIFAAGLTVRQTKDGFGINFSGLSNGALLFIKDYLENK